MSLQRPWGGASVSGTKEWLSEALQYDRVVAPLRDQVEAGRPLSPADRYRFSHAFKKAIFCRRSALQGAQAQLQDAQRRGVEDSLVREIDQYTNEIRLQVEESGNMLLDLIDRCLIPQAGDRIDDRVAYVTLKGDVYRYLSECHDEERREGDILNGLTNYRSAFSEASALSPIHPVRLGCALNFAVFNYEILQMHREAHNILVGALNQARDYAERGNRDLEEAFDDQTPIILQRMQELLRKWDDSEAQRLRDGAVEALTAAGRTPSASRPDRSFDIRQRDAEGNEVSYSALAAQTRACDEKAVEAVKMATETTGGAMTRAQRAGLSLTFKGCISCRRNMWALLNLDLSRANPESDYAEKLRGEREKVNEALTNISQMLLSLINDHLLPTSDNAESRVFFLTLKGDMYRHLQLCAEPGSEDSERITQQALAAYSDAVRLGAEKLSSLDPVRLAAVRNMCVLYRDIPGDRRRAIDPIVEILEATEQEDFMEDRQSAYEGRITLEHLCSFLEQSVDRSIIRDDREYDNIMTLIDRVLKRTASVPQPFPSGGPTPKKPKSTKGTDSLDNTRSRAPPATTTTTTTNSATNKDDIGAGVGVAAPANNSNAQPPAKEAKETAGAAASNGVGAGAGGKNTAPAPQPTPAPAPRDSREGEARGGVAPRAPAPGRGGPGGGGGGGGGGGYDYEEYEEYDQGAPTTQRPALGGPGGSTYSRGYDSKDGYYDDPESPPPPGPAYQRFNDSYGAPQQRYPPTPAGPPALSGPQRLPPTRPPPQPGQPVSGSMYQSERPRAPGPNYAPPDEFGREASLDRTRDRPRDGESGALSLLSQTLMQQQEMLASIQRQQEAIQRDHHDQMEEIRAQLGTIRHSPPPTPMGPGSLSAPYTRIVAPSPMPANAGLYASNPIPLPQGGYAGAGGYGGTPQPYAPYPATPGPPQSPWSQAPPVPTPVGSGAPPPPLPVSFPLVFTAALVVTWSPPAQQGPYICYRLFRSEPGREYECVYEGPGLMYYDAGLQEDSVYTYSVNALNTQGRWSPLSQPISQRTRRSA